MRGSRIPHFSQRLRAEWFFKRGILMTYSRSRPSWIMLVWCFPRPLRDFRKRWRGGIDPPLSLGNFATRKTPKTLKLGDRAKAGTKNLSNNYLLSWTCKSKDFKPANLVCRGQNSQFKNQQKSKQAFNSPNEEITRRPKNPNTKKQPFVLSFHRKAI